MAAPKSVESRDLLDLSQLHAPLLTDYLKSETLKAEMVVRAEEIKKLWVQKVPVRTGNLRSTAAVRARRVMGGRPLTPRWMADFTAGGPKAPYAEESEAEDHTLAEVLQELGYQVNLHGGGGGGIAANQVGSNRPPGG